MSYEFEVKAVAAVFVLLMLALVVLVIVDPFPATDRECQRLDGSKAHLEKWCTCENKWWGEPVNKSYTACVAKPSGEMK